MKLITKAICLLIITTSLVSSMRLKAGMKMRMSHLKRKYRNFDVNTVNDFLKEASLTEYHTEKALGSGSFGQVFAVKSKEGEFALKVVDYDIKDDKDNQIRDLALQEIGFLEKLKESKYCVHLKEHKNLDKHKVILMIMEKMETDLFDCIEGDRCYEQKIKGKELEIAKTLLEGLKDIHSHNIGHFDIKPENIMIKGEDFKYADFGLSENIGKDQVLFTRQGSPAYMDSSYHEGKEFMSHKSDVFSLGVVFLELHDKDLLNVDDKEEFINPAMKHYLDSERNGEDEYKEFESYCTLKDISLAKDSKEYLNCLAAKYMLVPYKSRKTSEQVLQLIEEYLKKTKPTQKETNQVQPKSDLQTSPVSGVKQRTPSPANVNIRGRQRNQAKAGKKRDKVKMSKTKLNHLGLPKIERGMTYKKQ